MSLQQLQLQIEKDYSRVIRLEKTKRKRKESLNAFLIKFFTEWVNEKATVYVDNKEVQTKITGQHNTVRRSLGDIYMICKYYYPKATLEDVVRELYINLRQHFTKGYRTSYCHGLHKRVFYYEADRNNLEHDKTKHDEYGKPYRYYLAQLNGEEFDEEDYCPHCGELYNECDCLEDDYDDED